MKKINICLMLLLSSCSAYYRSSSDIEITKYKRAYEFLLKETSEISSQGLLVYDSLVCINFQIFPNELDTSIKYPKNVIEVLDSLECSLDFKSTHYPQLSNVINSNTSSHSSIFFSKVYDKYLLMEILNNKGYPKATYARMKYFNTGVIYLFEFDNRNRVKATFKRTMIYN